MGGINCGMSGNRTRGGNFVGEYATVTHDLFSVLSTVASVNVTIENVVLSEQDNSETSLIEKDKAVQLLDQAQNQLANVSDHICLAKAILEPIYRQDDLKKEIINPYSKKDQQKSYEFWVDQDIMSSNKKLFDEVVTILKHDGEMGYLNYLDKMSTQLNAILGDLKKEYQSVTTTNSIANGTFQLAIRDAENSVTALTAKTLTLTNTITTALTTYCLVEYTSHVSISGKKLDYNDFTVNSDAAKRLKDDEM